MRVLRLEMEGLRSHRTLTTFDLAGRELVALVGPTGAGKSSVLEGICFALFGESTSGGGGRGGSANAELSSDGRTPITVRLEFAVGPTRFRLTRTTAPPARPEGSWTTRECWLEELGALDATARRWTSARQVGEQVRRVLGGLTREQFCQSVMLPQNRFAALIEAGPEERNKLLDNLLGLTALRTARDDARSRHRQVSQQVLLLRQRREDFPADPAAAIEEAREQVARHANLRERAVAAAETLEVLAGRYAALAQQADRLQSLAGLAGDGTALPGGEDADQLEAALQRLRDSAGRAHDALEGARRADADAADHLRDRQQALSRLEAEHGTDRDHATAETALDAYAEAVAGIPRAEHALAAARQRAVSAGASLAAARAAEAEALRAAESAAASADAAQSEWQLAASEAARRRSSVVEAIDVARSAAAAHVSAKESDAAAVAAREVAAEIETALERAATALASAETALDAAGRAAAAARASSACTPGDPCPVCQRPLPRGWHTPHDPGVAQAQRARDAARTVHDRVGRDLADARAAWEGAVARHESAGLAARTGMERAVTSAERGALPPPPLEGEAQEAWARAARAAVAAAEEAVARLEETARAARGNAEVAGARATQAAVLRSEADRAAAGAESDVGHAVEAVEQAHDRVGTCAARVPPRWRPDAAEAVAAVQARLDADRRARDAAAAHLEKAQRDRKVAADALSAAGAALDRDVRRPLDQLLRRLEQVGQALHAVAAELDLPIDVTARVPPADDDQGVATSVVDTALGALDAARHAAVRLAGVATTRADEARAEAAALLPQAAELLEGVAIGPGSSTGFDQPHPAAGPLGTATLAAVHRLVGAATAGLATSESELARLEEEVQRVADLDHRLGALEAWDEDLQGAVAILEQRAFPDYARQVRLGELAQVASDLFGRMSSGRYRFEDDLRIHDGESGAVRSATTLSGGEKFQASLALALAVAEIAGRSGVSLETLFLDEGFSGLDARALDLALDAIETEVASGRSIVLITHIGAVAQRVEDVFYVEPDGAGGCRTAWLDDNQRFDLGADLDLVS